MGRSDWPEKLFDNIKMRAGEKTAVTVTEGCGNLVSLEEKSCWARRAIKRLDEIVPDKDARLQIMTACSCPHTEAPLEELRAFYRQTGDIDRLIEKIYRNPFFIKPIRNKDVIFCTKAPRHPAEHAAAKTDREQRFYYCHCDFARVSTEEISPTHCYCGGGWYKKIWEAIIERPVRVELVKSVMLGDDVCRFAVHIS